MTLTDLNTELSTLNHLAQTMTDDLKQRTLDLYKTRLSEMDDTQLADEWHKRMNDVLGEFEWYMYHRGRKFVEWLLADKWEVENG